MSTADLFTALGSLATLLGGMVAAVGVIFAGLQLRSSKQIAGSEMLLRIDDILVRHDETHRKLRPGGVWHQTGAGPNSSDEWVPVEAYMGLFERLKTLVDGGIISLEQFDRLYGYRMDNIVANKVIRTEKLIKRGTGWREFIALWCALQRHRRAPADEVCKQHRS